MEKTAVIDFDNTLAGYDKWRGERVLGPPIPYALDAVRELIEWGWQVIVFTTRGDVAAIQDWLQRHNFPELPVNSCEHNPPGTSGKPIAEVYFDDRDCHVVGQQPYNWHKAMKRVRRKYQPRLDTFIDDASVWSSWWHMFFVAPFRRWSFRSHLEYELTCEEVRHNDKLTENQKEQMLLDLFDYEFGWDNR